MTALSDSMPGWFKRRRTEDGAGGNSGETANGAPGESGAAGEAGGAGAASAPGTGSGTGSETVSGTVSATTGGGSSQEPVVVWEAANLMEAQVVKGRLESEGIPAFVRSEALGVIYGLTAGGLARADVLVPGPLAEQAIEILFAEELPGELSGELPGDET